MLGLGLLGLHDLGESGVRWALVDVVWSTVAGIIIGAVLGFALARLAWKLRCGPGQHKLMDDFLGLGLIAVVYGISQLFAAWGFLAVFFAAVVLRQTEFKLSGGSSDTPEQPRAAALPRRAPAATVSEGSLLFKERLERLSELVLVLLVGGTLFRDSWSWQAVGLACFLFLVARPVSVLVGLSFSRTSWRIRGLVGWFGVRGIGSLYYLMYAIQHGLPEELALQLLQITLIVITLSILVHGISVKPLMARYGASH